MTLKQNMTLKQKLKLRLKESLKKVNDRLVKLSSSINEVINKINNLRNTTEAAPRTASTVASGIGSILFSLFFEVPFHIYGVIESVLVIAPLVLISSVAIDCLEAFRSLFKPKTENNVTPFSSNPKTQEQLVTDIARYNNKIMMDTERNELQRDQIIAEAFSIIAAQEVVKYELQRDQIIAEAFNIIEAQEVVKYELQRDQIIAEAFNIIAAQEVAVQEQNSKDTRINATVFTKPLMESKKGQRAETNAAEALKQSDLTNKLIRRSSQLKKW